ncbi:ATP-dependent protease [Paracoccus sp. S-4012]|uniref:LON peptidase substrate-binding domain-containing protein n=1 Tax=Paracoccus sp. S-4012 TaxID=2665648 RepID=UPI0012B01633|nr:LON peptidase substrate-binding domain-containing protein [Paracoccus sp. S-4012]MRX49729.1 ATP-dependent protease [Paracoccus sp. S-4012]
MAQGPDLPDAIPLFPLPGAVLMPRARLPLHIFEPRYLQMVDDALRSGNRLIGMIQPIGEGLAQVGSAGRIAGFQETEDGRLMISLRAISRFHLREAEEGFQPYLHGRVDWAGFEADRRGVAEEDPEFDREPFLRKLRRYMAARDLSTDWQATGEADDEMLVNALAMLLPLEVEEKQALLEAPTLAERRRLLDGFMEYALHGGSGGGEDILQ